MRKLLAFFILFVISISCSSNRQILNYNDEIKNTKIVFIFEENNNFVPIVKSGVHIGNSKTPTSSFVFQKTIEDIAKETSLNLVYQKQYEFPSGSVIPIIVFIDKIEWEWSTFSAIMNTSLTYKLPSETIKIIGSNKNYMFGTKKRNLYLSMKNGNYLLLSKILDIEFNKSRP